MSPPTARPASSLPPVPAYRNAAIQALSERLEDARVRRARLREAGKESDILDAEILALRRQLREGGQLLAGDALGDGRYLLVKPAGRGGFAVVWEAYDRQNNQTVAIKVLHSHLVGDPLRRDRFFRGARVMMMLPSAAVVQVLDPEAEDGGFHYFVMEFLPGGNLSEAVLKGRISQASLLSLILRVSEAVASAHASGIVHRDIKPSNVLLDGEGNPKLTDFDLVGVPDTTGGTRTGALGTLLYAAPECLDKPQDATARADVYGLGMTAIFCLFGKELARAVLRDPEPVISQLSCSEPVKAVLRKAVAWEPGERFADAEAWGSALRAVLKARFDDGKVEAARTRTARASNATLPGIPLRNFRGKLAPRAPSIGSTLEQDIERSPSAVPGGRSYIAVIGIDRYPRWVRLANAVRDAEGVLQVFERLGFTPVGAPLLDDRATGEAMHRLVVDDLARLGPEDSLVLFFAGHGHTVTRRYDDTSLARDGYIIPVDGDRLGGRIASWLRLESWLLDVTRLSARHILVILDACHSGISLGPILKWRTRGAEAGYLEPLRNLSARRSRRIITSALDDQLALDSGPAPGHSLFTGCLIEALTGGLFQTTGRSVVTGSEIARYVQRRVTEYPGSAQTPDWGALELDNRGEMLVRIAAEDAERTMGAAPAADVESGIAWGTPQAAAGVAQSSAPQPSSPSVTGRRPSLWWWLIFGLIISVLTVTVISMVSGGAGR